MQNKIKILIADDNANIRQTLQDVLTEKEYLVETVGNGYELLVYLKERSADIIILDIMMPGRSGIEIISTIRSASPCAKIIIYTGFQKYKNSVYAHIVDKFLLKNDDIQGLLQVIEEFSATQM